MNKRKNLFVIKKKIYVKKHNNKFYVVLLTEAYRKRIIPHGPSEVGTLDYCITNQIKIFVTLKRTD